MTDNVKHPSHYCKGGMECIDAIKAAVSDITDPFEAYCTGNIIKYIWRWNDKGGTEDLNKAKQYADMIIAYHDNKDKPDMGNPITDTSESGIPITDKPETEKSKWDDFSNLKLRALVCENFDENCTHCPFEKNNNLTRNACPVFVRQFPDAFRRTAIEYLEGKE